MASKITVKFGANEFTFEGDVTFAEVRPILETWLSANDGSTTAAIQSLTSDLKGENDRERQVVTDNTPT
jgi:hypothetical protein